MTREDEAFRVRLGQQTLEQGAETALGRAAGLEGLQLKTRS